MSVKVGRYNSDVFVTKKELEQQVVERGWLFGWVANDLTAKVMDWNPRTGKST
jgi:hypothetical protein